MRPDQGRPAHYASHSAIKGRWGHWCRREVPPAFFFSIGSSSPGVVNGNPPSTIRHRRAAAPPLRLYRSTPSPLYRSYIRTREEPLFHLYSQQEPFFPMSDLVHRARSCVNSRTSESNICMSRYLGKLSHLHFLGMLYGFLFSNIN